MKTLTIIFAFIILCGCADNNNKAVKQTTYYFYLSHSKQRMKVDTLKYEYVNHIDTVDELLATEYFEYQDKSHVIKMYSSDNRAPVDGGELKYTLDSVGIIYQRAVWWPNFFRLSSYNDSVNDLISTAFGHILMRKSLRCFYCDEEFTHKPKTLELK